MKSNAIIIVGKDVIFLTVYGSTHPTTYAYKDWEDMLTDGVNFDYLSGYLKVRG